MRNLKNSAFYIFFTGGFSILMYWIITKGKLLEDGSQIISTSSDKTQWEEFIDSMQHNLQHPLALLLAQIITIILMARVFGWISRKLGQPTVIGEMIAGIVLGPSLVGMYFPEYSQLLFPKESLGNLQFLSQIGLILFMFVVGMELDLKAIQNKAKDAVVISHASIIFPFTLGVGLAYFIYEQYAPKQVEFLSFALFLGIAMSITAFPVLARIVQERGIHKTKLGAIVITCAAADDITAWCILATVIAIVKAGSITSSLYVIGLALVYVFVMLTVVRPFLNRVAELKNSRAKLSKPVVAIFLVTLIISAYVSEIIGIHALFGAFMAGAIMPDNNRFRSIIIEKVEDVSLIVLLPLFFVFTGLRTQIGLINDSSLWEILACIIGVAVAGKFLGSAIAAKFVGQNWKDSLTIGALMNTRGLMELIVLNIGYDLGVLSDQVFTMMVLMALITTFMTGPALDFINFCFRKSKDATVSDEPDTTRFRIIVSFGNAAKGRLLLRLANCFIRKEDNPAPVTLLHLSQSNELHSFNLEEQERRSFAPVISESEQLDVEVETIFKAVGDIESEIADTANKGDFDLLIIGVGRSIFDGSFLGRLLGFTTRIINPDRLLDKFTGKEGLFENSPFDERTRQIVTRTKMPVAIFIEKDFKGFDRVFLPLFSENDSFLATYAQKLAINNDSRISVLDLSENEPLAVENLIRQFPQQAAILADRTMKKEFLEQQDLMLVSFESWKKLVDSQSPWLANAPATVIIKP
ncbi:cation:proton antiporter domain-containing protein [Flavobacterium silvaticum]|uniref:Cation/H(+) antiporter n=1 Tax=Flavobacterium silvaticum TaxID=1852020 RepID=A0A972FM44_9FLAO|nr:cation:proton antiporter [Flavobacterium silvaticum]NMH28584.1 cation/H(+) antiporter [Flavobacterium silvaticum]